MLVNKFSLSAILIALTAIGIAFRMPLTGCNSKTSGMGSEVMGLEIITNLPLMSLDTVVQNPDTIFCFQKDSVLIFKMPVQLFVSKIFTSSDGEFSNDSIIRIGTRYQYYVYSKDNEYGLRFDSLGSERGAIFLVDSLLAKQSVTNFDQFYEKKIGNDSLVRKYGSKRRGIYVEEYIPRIKKDNTYSDSTIMNFSSSLRKYHFTISPFLREVKNLNLQSFRLVYNGSPHDHTRSYRMPRYLSFVINELPKAPYEDIEAIYGKFIQKKVLFSEL